MLQLQNEHTYWFANRVDQLDIVARRIEILQTGGGVFQSVLNFYGIPGVGKTALLTELSRHARLGKWQRPGIAPVLSAFTDLAAVALQRENYQAGPEALALQMAQIESQTKVVSLSSDFKVALADFRKQQITNDQDEEAWYRVRQAAKRVADSFVLHVSELIKKKPILLLFDNSDKFPTDAFDWLEFEVFSPLVQIDRVLLVLAGCSPVRWKRFEVRRRVYLSRLNPPDDRVQLVSQQAPSWSKVADNIVQLTFGLPTANETVVEALDEIAGRQVVDAGTFDQFRPKLMERLSTNLVENRLWKDVDRNLWPVFRLVAPLRQFDITTLRNILPKLMPDDFAQWGGNQYLVMLNRLIDTSLVEWSTERKAYILDDTLRHILALDMETRALPRAIEIHRIAVALYDEWLAAATDSRGSYLVEWLYHRAKGYALDGKELTTVAALATADLQHQLTRLYDRPGKSDERDQDSVRRLLNELSLDDELAMLVGKQGRDSMVQRVQEIEKILMARLTAGTAS
jgi:hypothetical protein